MRRNRLLSFTSCFVALATAGFILTGCFDGPDPPSLPAISPAPPRITPATRAPEPTPTDPPSPEPANTSTPVAPVEVNALALIESFVEAPFRVVAVAKSPFAPYSLIVASERSAARCGSPEAPQRCTADETCGSLYTSPVCYFFVEPAFDATADPATRYVTRWPDQPAVSALVTGSIRFVDARTVEFRAEGADGAYAVQEVWWLDLVTGALAMQSRVEQGEGS